MVLDSYELEKLADDVYKDRRITSSVYCGNCGYNLYTLPFVYTCPECGSAYNARPLVMEGIFVPYEVDFPLRDMATTAACGIGTFVFLHKAVNPLNGRWLVLSILFAGLFVVLALHIRTRLRRYFRGLEIARRVAEQEADA